VWKDSDYQTLRFSHDSNYSDKNPMQKIIRQLGLPNETYSQKSKSQKMIRDIMKGLKNDRYIAVPHDFKDFAEFYIPTEKGKDRATFILLRRSFHKYFWPLLFGSGIGFYFLKRAIDWIF
jgi:hypothetical protein